MEEHNLVLKPSITQHQIEVEDENRKFEHTNTYKSCCLTINKRALNFFTQAIFSGAIIGFCIVMLSTNTDCATFSRYSPSDLYHWNMGTEPSYERLTGDIIINLPKLLKIFEKYIYTNSIIV